MTLRAIGWRAPVDRSHERRYALEAAMPTVPTPVVIGINWYEQFDRPVKRNGAWWIADPAFYWGEVRGGHSVCLRPPIIPDLELAWEYYDQESEGACTGFAVARAATLFNRRLYDGFLQYEAAKRNDQWAGEKYEGSSVNGALQGLRLEGAWRVIAMKTQPSPFPADGIAQFRWASSVDQIMLALKSKEGFVRILNSWGKDYPPEVRMPVSSLGRLFKERGEFGVPIDRAPKLIASTSTNWPRA